MEIRVPQLGEGADSGTVVSILVKVGDEVKKDQTVIELENEKAVAPIPSTGEGVVSAIHVNEGDKASVGQVIMVLGGEAGGAPEAATETSTPAPQAAPAPAAQPLPPVQMPTGPAPVYQSPSGMPPAASPSVRKVARDLGIDLTRIRGSEAGGRIVMSDIRNYVAQIQAIAMQGAPQAPAAPAAAESAQPKALDIDFSQWGEIEKETLTSLRKTIARRMHESWSEIPHVTQFDEADITDILKLRKKHLKDYDAKGARLTLTSFIMKAAVEALKAYPVFNTTLDLAANELIYKKYFHLGVAVDTDQGLIVPVMRDVDKKDMVQVSKEIGEMAEKTRDRKISPADLKGGTFTISNLGGIGGTHFTPIVNSPEVAILGIGQGVQKPVYVDKKLEPRIMLPICVSYDHRVIDGANGARFIRKFIETLEGMKDSDVKIS